MKQSGSGDIKIQDLTGSLIADIDSPRGGFIVVKPPNLLSLSQSLALALMKSAN